MKKTIGLLLLFFVTTVTHSLLYAVKPASPEGGSEKITLEMLNCKTGMYKTYTDFVNQAPLNYTFSLLDYLFLAGANMKKYEIDFLDKSGKKVVANPNDFWGYKSQYGKLYRTGRFANGKITSICFQVTYAAKDLVVYEPLDPGALEITPRAWCSTDLNDEILPADEYFKTHPKQKATYTEIEAGIANCFKRPAGKHLNHDEELYRISSCIAQLPGIIGWYDRLATRPEHKVRTETSSYIKK